MSVVIDQRIQGAIKNILEEKIMKKSEVTIISDIFTIYAYDKLKDVLKNVGKAKFLFNEPTFINKLKFNNKDIREFEIQMIARERNVSEFPLEITLKNNMDQNMVANDFYNFVSKKAEVKSALRPNTIPSKMIYVKNDKLDDFLINGSLSFSLEGLGYGKNNLFHTNTLVTNNLDSYRTQINAIWNDSTNVTDVKELFLEYLKNIYKENSPELVYYLTLFNLFNDDLVNMDDIARLKEGTGIHKTKIWNMLYNFQRDAVVGAIKKLELYNGCIIADSVGLGKTFEALAIIKYYELRNQRVLVLVPKKLRNNWNSFKTNYKTNILIDDRFNYDILNHTDLSRETGFSGDIDLEKINWNNYDLIVIDESHNFRNNPPVKGRKTRYQKLMEDVIQGGVKSKILMLSATPVNNRLTDLKNQIMFITEDNDAAFKENLNIESINDTLRIAQQRFNEWGKLSEELRTTENLIPTLDYNFFKLLNTVTIARSRKHITKFYDTKDIGNFPERLKPKSIYSEIDNEGIFPELSEVNNEINKLKLPIYSPLEYVLPTKQKEYEEKYEQFVKDGTLRFKQIDRERSLVNLMRINILKRLESSVFSFRLTIERILNKIESMIKTIQTNNDFTLDTDDVEEDEIEDLEIGNKIKVKVKDLDKIRIKQDLLDDKRILSNLLNITKRISSEKDFKLQTLKNEISFKIKNNLNENNNKVIIFTAFSDTADYLYDHISGWVKREFGLVSGLVTGGKTITNSNSIRNQFEDILVSFSPKSNNYEAEQEIDILIATDVISEGQNLQDCDYLINYDIHWNPVRIIQRFGRIDRIGSKNKSIQLVNFWPNIDLDEYINLEGRVKNRMTMVDITATGDDDPLDTISKDLKYRRDQLQQLKEEVVEIEEFSGGISITDLNLDDFIMDLDNYMKKNKELIENYPTGVHAITSIPERLKDDIEKGVIFTLRQKRYIENDKKDNSLYPYHLVYISENGKVIVRNSNPKKILDIYKAMCKGNDYVLENLVNIFNKETSNGNNMSKYTDLLEKSVFDIKGLNEEKGIESLFKLGKTSIIDNHIKDLDDFELITFLVIK